MKIDENKLKLINHKKIPINKLKDEALRLQQVKFNAQCPYFGHFYPCLNKITKNYCPYDHIGDCRKAFSKFNEGVEEG